MFAKQHFSAEIKSFAHSLKKLQKDLLSTQIQTEMLNFFKSHKKVYLLMELKTKDKQ